MVLDHWEYGDEEDPLHQGLFRFVDEQEFLGALRRLIDTPLEAARAAGAGECLVEYSFGHIYHVEELAALYPDAQLVHLVRDGRMVVTRLTSPLFAFTMADSIQRWQEENETVLAAEDVPNLHTVRLEDLHADPIGTLRALAAVLGRAAPDADLDRAAAWFAEGGDTIAVPEYTGAMMEVLASDLLTHFGYHVGEPGRLHRVARAQLRLESLAASTGDAVRRLYERLASSAAADS
jgi:hypothetical protein